jgi:hypothetical protein
MYSESTFLGTPLPIFTARQILLIFWRGVRDSIAARDRDNNMANQGQS